MKEGGPLEHSIEGYLPELERVLKREAVVLAYLYGSQARDDSGPTSDVDVAVLFQPVLPREERGRRLLSLTAELTSVFRRDDVFVADLAHASPLLRNEVRLEGRLIYCVDDALRIEFEVRALRDYEDTKPLRRIQQLYLLDRIERGEMGRYSRPQEK